MSDRAKNIYRASYKIRTADSDKNGSLKISALMLMLQEAASEHADILGVGQRELFEKKLGWALSKAAIDIFRLPKWGERLTIETWVSQTGRVSTHREFIVNDAHGKTVSNARTQWVLFDVEKRKIERIEKLESDLGDNGIVASSYSFDEKIPVPSIPISSVDLRATRNDIDLNCHVNNATYVAWGFESLPDYIADNFIPKKIRINFISEVELHAQVKSECSIESQPDDSIPYTILSIKNIERGGRECARLGILWNKADF